MSTSLLGLPLGFVLSNRSRAGGCYSTATINYCNVYRPMFIKLMLKAILPESVVKAIRKSQDKDPFKEYRDIPTHQVFTKIYEKGVWGKSDDPSQPFFSGSGSHDEGIVSAYVGAVQQFLSTFDMKPNVVDLGCGDFAVGSRIRQLCDNYIACDIVPKLIAFNKEKYKTLNVNFRVLDLTSDDLPDGDIVFVRQVLQHLSNEQVLRALPKIYSKYKYLVLTEHLPDSQNFKHNLDRPAGPGIRLGIQSGIVLTSPPFNLMPINERMLCQVPETNGIITTTLYQFF